MTDAKCYMCQALEPAFLCLCEEVKVCRNCISQHLLSDPSPRHKPLPLARGELIQAVRDEITLSQQSARSVDHSDALIEHRKVVKQVLQKELSRLQAFKTSAEVRLQQAKRLWEQQISKVTSEALVALYAQVEKLGDELLQTLSEINSSDASLEKLWGEGMTAEDELLLLQIDLKPVDLTGSMKSAISVSIQQRKEDAAVDPVLYKFFGGTNQVGVFDAKTERYMKTIQATARFFHNSCSCLSPDGLIYITGGSLTGRSRNDAAAFNSKTGVVEALQPMQVARRSHASICIGQNCYVFGGLIEEDRTSLCEKYVSGTATWMTINKMHERRAYVGCCAYRDLVFIGGGAETSTCEVFDPASETFQLLTFTQVAIQDNCCLMSLTDSILLFHGNFQGEISRLNPVSNSIVKEKDMCYGNSWSSCLPVIANNCVYMLRSESVFKYNIETGESAYVLRMSKAPKRQLDFE